MFIIFVLVLNYNKKKKQKNVKSNNLLNISVIFYITITKSYFKLLYIVFIKNKKKNMVTNVEKHKTKRKKNI